MKEVDFVSLNIVENPNIKNSEYEWSTPEEIANAILYLLTLAPRDMTGQFLDIYGS